MNIKLVREELKRKKLTQNELAEVTGISKAQISNILTGRSRPKLETIERIAAALGVQVSLLLAPGPVNVMNGHVNIVGSSRGRIENAVDHSNIYTTTGEIDGMRKEIENLRELIRSKEETISSLKMTISIMGGGN